MTLLSRLVHLPVKRDHLVRLILTQEDMGVALQSGFSFLPFFSLVLLCNYLSLPFSHFSCPFFSNDDWPNIFSLFTCHTQVHLGPMMHKLDQAQVQIPLRRRIGKREQLKCNILMNQRGWKSLERWICFSPNFWGSQSSKNSKFFSFTLKCILFLGGGGWPTHTP